MAKEENEGVSLSSVFDRGSSDSPEPSSSSEEKPEGSEEKTEEKSDASTEESTSPVTEEKPSEEKQDVAKEDKSDKDKPAKKKEEKPAEKEVVDEKAEKERLEKRFKDTQSWANREHQSRLQLESKLQSLGREVEILRKKADGTWTEEDDRANEVSMEDVAASSLNVGKALASRSAAYKLLGQEKVDEALNRFSDLFENRPDVQAIVLNDESPVSRALDMLEQYDFQAQYGSNPKEVRDKLEAEVTKKLEAKLRKEITQEILDGKKKKESSPSGLSSSRGSSGIESGNIKGKGQNVQPSLIEVFGK